MSLQLNQLFIAACQAMTEPKTQTVVRIFQNLGNLAAKGCDPFCKDDAVLAKLREIGVDYAQGFGVGEPRPIDEIASIGMADLLAG